MEHHFVSELWPDGNVPGPFGPFFRTRSTQNVSIFVGNLPFRAEQEDVTELFAQFGEVVNCALPLERDTGRKRGFAFVEMSDDAAEEAAIEGLQGAELMHQLSALETFDRSFFSCIIGHFHKSKSALSAGIPLKGKGTIHDFTELSKQLSHVLLLSAEGKVANKNAHVLRGPGTKKWTKGAWNIAIGP